MEQEAVSTGDDRQPYHIVDGNILTQAEWRQKLRDATELFELFKRAAYLDHEL